MYPKLNHTHSLVFKYCVCTILSLSLSLSLSLFLLQLALVLLLILQVAVTPRAVMGPLPKDRLGAIVTTIATLLETVALI